MYIEIYTVIRWLFYTPLQIAEATNSILEIHSELSDALKDIKEFTG